MERIRRTMATQLADFDTMKKALMKDLQDRCEKVNFLMITIATDPDELVKVVELEISLDETREQYNTIVKSTNSKAHQKKTDWLLRNLEALSQVQRQVRTCCCYIRTFSHKFRAAGGSEQCAEEGRFAGGTQASSAERADTTA